VVETAGADRGREIGSAPVLARLVEVEGVEALGKNHYNPRYYFAFEYNIFEPVSDFHYVEHDTEKFVSESKSHMQLVTGTVLRYKEHHESSALLNTQMIHNEALRIRIYQVAGNAAENSCWDPCSS